MQQCIFSNKDTLLFVYKRNNSHKLHIQKRIRISLFIEIRSHKSDRFTPVIFATIRCLKRFVKSGAVLVSTFIYPCHPSFLIYEFKSDTSHTIS